MKRSEAKNNAPFKLQRNYAVELRIADGPWYTTGVVCESRKEAESIGAMLAKFWLGAAESRVVPLKHKESAKSNVARVAVDEGESLFAQLAGV